MFEKIVRLPSGFGNAIDRRIVTMKFFDAFLPTHQANADIYYYHNNNSYYFNNGCTVI